MPTDTSERGLESVIVGWLTGQRGDETGGVAEIPAAYDADYKLGQSDDFDADHAIDTRQLFAFLTATQPDEVAKVNAGAPGPSRTKFLDRLQGEITRRGVVDVLVRGVQHQSGRFTLMYGTPTPGNIDAAGRFAANRFTVTRQLHYSRTAAGRSLDLALFINGLPVVTFELKNRLTNQTVQHAIRQYQTDRDPRELIFMPGRCAVHFAVDDQQVWFCAELAGKASVFLPFNRGADDGAGNPPNPGGIMTDYLWRQVLTRRGLTNILENYARAEPRKATGGSTGKGRMRVTWPRYHQLDVVRRLLADASERGAGHRYLIQHSAGSGKSNSIAWLAHQLISVRPPGALPDTPTVFDSVIIVTDRRVLDDQIEATVKQAGHVRGIVGAVDSSRDLRDHLRSGRRIITTTLQKFPMVVDTIETDLSDRRFAIIIDEAHSSQGGRAAAQMNQALATGTPPLHRSGEGAGGRGGSGDPHEKAPLQPHPQMRDGEGLGWGDDEDRINELIAGRRLLGNASYFAFTATPKNRTLELFGRPVPEADGSVAHRPFHAYTMKQAIQEGFIMDVLASYTPISSWYRLAKAVEDDPEYDSARAQARLRQYVESHQHAIRQKARIMVDHFHDHVVGRRKIGGRARAMVATNGIDRAIDYYRAISACLTERRSPYRAILAFSGEREVDGQQVTEAWFNGFPSSQIPTKLAEDPYRFLIVADKFLTGYDEPLLHTMYVDKTLSGIKAVQALSRLNRSAPGKTDTFVLDFANDPGVIEQSFAPYYRTTVLSDATDPNKLHDLVAELDGAAVYTGEQVDELVALFLASADRPLLDPILDACTAVYRELDEDGQVAFKGRAKAFVRTYNFLGSVLNYGFPDWERRSIFLTLLIPKLPAPPDVNLIDGILDSIDMESYRIEKRATIGILLGDEEGAVDPVPVGDAGAPPEALRERLSAILDEFNENYGNIDWSDPDRIRAILVDEIPGRLLLDEKVRNAINQGDPQNLAVELAPALQRIILGDYRDQGELFREYMNNPDFKRLLTDRMRDYALAEPRQPGLTGSI